MAAELYTSAELHALPLRTTLRDRDGDRWRKDRDGWVIKRPLGWGRFRFSTEFVAGCGPLTVEGGAR